MPPILSLCATVALTLACTACGRSGQPAPEPERAPVSVADVPEQMAMGGAKSVTTFFVTSAGLGRGGDLGGLAGADAHCQALAAAEGAGDHTWRAYLSTTATAAAPAVNARDRIGPGPWYNAEGLLIAANVGQLHGGDNRIRRDTAVTERLDPVNGVGEMPVRHDMLTGSQRDGTAFPRGDDLTCGNWTSSGAGRAQVGHHDRSEDGVSVTSWNSAHDSSGCSQTALESTGGAGLFYCFAID